MRVNQYVLRKLQNKTFKKTSTFLFACLLSVTTRQFFFLIYLNLWFFFLLKARIAYYIHNWVYTTNHKRIAVNYFWFVVLAGVVGMVLATAIRLEFAYPGVGIFAGDSLQYLTIASAHGVIMVFFMIMPLLFGAFGNFLLPTQLGVHDVAFPRLNSAAFWFLPAGLLMLGQMVCLDRRFQRINCFNMRELQSLLKQRFFNDLIVDNLQQQTIYKMLIETRFKEFFTSTHETSLFLYSQFSLKKNYFRFFNNFQANLNEYNYNFKFINRNNNWYFYISNFSITEFRSVFHYFKVGFAYGIDFLQFSFAAWTYVQTNATYTNLINFWNIIVLFFTNFFNKCIVLIDTVLSFFFYQSVPFFFNTSSSYNPITSKHVYRLTFFWWSWVKLTFFPYFTWNNAPKSYKFVDTDFFNSRTSGIFFSTLNEGVMILEFIFFKIQILWNFFREGIAAVLSFLELGFYFDLNWIKIFFENANIFIANLFKVKNSTVSTALTNNFHDINFFFETNNETRGNSLLYPVFKYDYRAGDYFSKLYKETYLFLFPSLINLTGGLRMAPWYHSITFRHLIQENLTLFMSSSSQYTIPSIYYLQVGFFFFNPLTQNFNLSNLNPTFIAFTNLTQAFNNHFLTASIQYRVYNNWRNLKFSREAWRCKALVARHQKNLMQRYLTEDNLFWSIERNARDLLPGWAMITPFSSRTRFTAIGKVDIGLMGVLFVLNSSIISSSNFLLTYRYLSTLNNRKMRDARSFFAEGMMVTAWMMLAANPMLVIGIIMLLCDRHWQTSFFDYSGGGDTILFQHMFWFFGHPEVYIIMIPVFGFVNTLLSYYLRKRVSARASLMYSMYTIAFLGFFVWGHHMYMVGLAHTTRMLFSTLTVMISVPAATKLMHWCVTLVNSAFVVELPLVLTLTFIFFFVSGGISGMCVAHTGMDILFHDTFYVIGHFHVMLAGGAMFGSFGAFYFYFPAIFGVKYNRILSYLHYIYYLLGQFLTVIPMFWLGYAGMPRRVLDYPSSMGGWHSLISAGHLISVAGMMCFFLMIFESLRKAKAQIRNTFGINRYNIRLNFYLFILARVEYFRQRYSWFLRVRAFSTFYRKKNFETLETTLISYHLFK